MPKRYDKIIERSKEVIGERNTAEIIGIAQKLLHQIEEGIEKSNTGTHLISMKDIVKTHIPQTVRERWTLESLFCILSSAFWHHYISTDISYDAEDFCLYLIFSKPSPRDEEPSVENCTKKWMYIYKEI